MLKKNDEIILETEKMVYEGAALARIDGFPIFIEDAAPNEKVKIKVTSVNKNYAKGSVLEIVESSKFRIKPFCALHNACGGCQWQYIDYNEQLNQKRNIVFETVKKITGEEIEVMPLIASPEITGFRHKIQYPVSQTKVSKRLLTGYYKKHSHELINIKHCPIQPAKIDDLVTIIKEKAMELQISAYNEKKHIGTLRHIVFKHSSYNNKTLIVFVINSEDVPDKIDKLASFVYKNCEDIAGVCINFNTSKNNVILGSKGKCLIGDDYYTENLDGKLYQISAESFFQVNPFSAEIILKTVKNMILENNSHPSILDAYAGVSTFGVYLSDISKSVICVENVSSASEDAITNKFANNCSNLEILNGDAAEILTELAEKNHKFDAVILDPPRKGCDERALDSVYNLTKDLIIYVSCNPSTLARDLKYLKEKGFITKYIQPVDMFPHTYHIESIALLKRNV